MSTPDDFPAATPVTDATTVEATPVATTAETTPPAPVVVAIKAEDEATAAAAAVVAENVVATATTTTTTRTLPTVEPPVPNKRRRRNAHSDENAPVRFRSPYILFYKERQQQVRAEHAEKGLPRLQVSLRY